MSLVGFGVKNLRCLTDTGVVPIKPITLLVGKNSSGKSTFLRAFPLLRQSVANARSSPILWHHKDYVDFGSFDIAVNERAPEPSITFTFAVELPEHERVGVGAPSCELSMTLVRAERGTRVSSYDLRVAERAVRIEIEASSRVKSITIDGRPVELEKDLWLSGPAALVPSIGEVVGQKVVYPPHNGFEGEAAIGRETFLSGALEREAVVARLPDLLSALDRQVADYMYRVAYLGPRRAVGSRFYRLDDVDVGEIHPRSENLASFLASLSKPEMEDFVGFTRGYLGFEPAIRVDGLNAEILVKEQYSSTYKNVADVGSGYAEVLPLCAAIWLNVGETGAGRPLTSLITLEQPELHLHPAYQPKLARMIVGGLESSRNEGREVKLLVETHSEALVNGLGDFVEDKVLSPDDVQIVLFDQDPETRATSIRFARYDEEGALRDWPFGFFAPVEDEVFWRAAGE